MLLCLDPGLLIMPTGINVYPHLCRAALPPLPCLQIQAPQVSQVAPIRPKPTVDEQLVLNKRGCMAAAMGRPRACKFAR
jgi:hypothetical protein